MSGHGTYVRPGLNKKIRHDMTCHETHSAHGAGWVLLYRPGRLTISILRFSKGINVYQSLRICFFFQGKDPPRACSVVHFYQALFPHIIVLSYPLALCLCVTRLELTLDIFGKTLKITLLFCLQKF